MQNQSNLKYTHNENIRKHLKNIIQNNKLSNAYIFYGPRGIGKKAIALEFIKTLLLKDNFNSNSEKKISENNHPDLEIIEPTFLDKGQLIKQSNFASERQKNIIPIIRIDQIRNAKYFISQKSIQADKKIVLIDDAHLLNESASNCLLKTLEEPSNGLFILLTSKLNLLLDTIKSRCQRIRFNNLSNYQLKEFLKNNINSDIDTDHDHNYIEEFIYLSNGSPGKMIENINTWNTIPKNIKEKIISPINSLPDIYILSKNISEHLDYDQQEFLVEYIQVLWWKTIRSEKIIKVLEELKSNLKNNIQPRISWEMILLRISMIIYPDMIN